MEIKHAFFDKKYWSNNRFAWAYACFILILTVVFAIILKSLGIYESMPFRSINIFFILLGFILLIWDFKRSTHKHLTYVQAFLLLARTGIYFCFLFLPALLLFIELDYGELDIVREKESLAPDFTALELVLSTLLETVATAVIAAIVVAFTANWGKKKNLTT